MRRGPGEDEPFAEPLSPDAVMAEATARAGLLLSLRQRGLRAREVMRAMEEVPRPEFLEPVLRHLAWNDQALPIECGQSISQPSLVARMTEALDLAAGHRVLEIGSGSGYHAAILARIAGHVTSIDRFHTLVRQARERLARLGIAKVQFAVADGLEGHAPQAPYDRILLTGAVELVPPVLFRQLAPGGVLVAPVGPEEGPQRLMRYELRDGGTQLREIAPARFVSLLPGVARVL